MAPTPEEVSAGPRFAVENGWGTDRALRCNIDLALRWLAWLRASFPETTSVRLVDRGLVRAARQRAVVCRGGDAMTSVCLRCGARCLAVEERLRAASAPARRINDDLQHDRNIGTPSAKNVSVFTVRMIGVSHRRSDPAACCCTYQNLW